MQQLLRLKLSFNLIQQGWHESIDSRKLTIFKDASWMD